MLAPPQATRNAWSQVVLQDHCRPAPVVIVDQLPPRAVGDHLVQELVQPDIAATLAEEPRDGITSRTAAARALDPQHVELIGDVREDELTGAGRPEIVA